tara:strand:- start:114864 stop:115328 length:465 start_codon:yes stop_codon:yes gene_type:complete
MTKKTLKLIGVLCLLVLSSCGERTPVGPDLSNIEARDYTFFNQIYNRCNINNSTSDCNCVARIHVEHRGAAYDAYAADYEGIHKPKLEAEISEKADTLAEKTKNRSDERVLEALEEDLHRLEKKLAAGVDNIDDFNLPFLPPRATDACILMNSP